MTKWCLNDPQVQEQCAVTFLNMFVNYASEYANEDFNGEYWLESCIPFDGLELINHLPVHFFTHNLGSSQRSHLPGFSTSLITSNCSSSIGLHKYEYTHSYSSPHSSNSVFSRHPEKVFNVPLYQLFALLLGDRFNRAFGILHSDDLSVRYSRIFPLVFFEFLSTKINERTRRIEMSNHHRPNQKNRVISQLPISISILFVY